MRFVLGDIEFGCAIERGNNCSVLRGSARFWVGKTSGGKNGNSLQYFAWEILVIEGTYSPKGHQVLDMTEHAMVEIMSVTKMDSKAQEAAENSQGWLQRQRPR